MLELPLPIEPVELGEPVLGEVELGDVELGEVVDELPDELPPMPCELLVPPLLEPDLLKCASHSEREIWPSLLVSTDAKLGVVALPELLELGELDEPPAALLGVELPDFTEPLAAPPVCPWLLAEVGDWALPDVEELSAATASPDRTKSAAAVVTVTVLIIWILL